MKSALLTRIDQLIDQYKKANRDQSPLYIVLSPDEAKALAEDIRKLKNYPPDQIITSYQNIKITSTPALLDGKLYVTDELPETGS